MSTYDRSDGIGMRVCATSDGARIGYAVVGEGPPLLVSPDFFSSVDCYLESHWWRQWKAAFARDHRVIRYDSRGVGFSRQGKAATTLDEQVRDLEAVVKALGLHEFALVGFGHGVPACLAFAQRNAHRISRLVLTNGYVRGLYASREGESAKWGAALEQILSQGWDAESAVYRQMFSHLLMQDANLDVRNWFCRHTETISGPNLAAMFRVVHHVDCTAATTDIRIPSLVLHQRSNPLVSLARGCELASSLPNSEFVELEGANHLLEEDELTWPRFVNKVRSFLVAGFPNAPTAMDELTAREHSVLAQVARGMSNAEISHEFSISQKTVRNHLTSIFAKLGVASRSRAIVCAREAGIGVER